MNVLMMNQQKITSEDIILKIKSYYTEETEEMEEKEKFTLDIVNFYIILLKFTLSK